MVLTRGRAKGGEVKVVAGSVVVIFVAVLVLLVVTQIDKWTCGPPDGVWVEASETCQSLP
jgi:hypothetical protein